MPLIGRRQRFNELTTLTPGRREARRTGEFRGNSLTQIRSLSYFKEINADSTTFNIILKHGITKIYKNNLFFFIQYVQK